MIVNSTNSGFIEIPLFLELSVGRVYLYILLFYSCIIIVNLLFCYSLKRGINQNMYLLILIVIYFQKRHGSVTRLTKDPY